MITGRQLEEFRQRAVEYTRKAGIVLTAGEKAGIEVADFGLGSPDKIGLEIIVYVNTSRCCAKELMLFPGQTCAEHRHPPLGSDPGKEETFRCRWGRVYLYVPGPHTENPRAVFADEDGRYLTVRHEIILEPGDQYTLAPDTLHWFQGGPEGAVVSEFSTSSHDESDYFTDPRIRRITKVGG